MKTSETLNFLKTRHAVISLPHVLQAPHEFEILCYSPRNKMGNTLYHQYRLKLYRALYEKYEINYKNDILLI